MTECAPMIMTVSPLCKLPNAAVQRPREALSCAQHAHDEMTHLLRACDDVSRSPVTVVMRLAHLESAHVAPPLAQRTCLVFRTTCNDFAQPRRTPSRAARAAGCRKRAAIASDPNISRSRARHPIGCKCDHPSAARTSPDCLDRFGCVSGGLSRPDFAAEQS